MQNDRLAVLHSTVVKRSDLGNLLSTWREDQPIGRLIGKYETPLLVFLL